MKEASIYPHSESAILLGRLHWCLSAASQNLRERAFVNEPRPGTKIIKSVRTAFGHEVANDEVLWWVSKREQNIIELVQETQKAIEVTEKIIVTIKGLDCAQIESYKSLIRSLEKLTDTVYNEISVLLDYVLFLRRRDFLAPSMLLTTKVWAATPLGERRINVLASEFDSESESVQQKTIECVYGIQSIKGAPHYSLASARAIEEDGGTPERAALLAASVDIRKEMLYYFRCLRTCMENILAEIEKNIDLDAIIQDVAFWRVFIQQATLAKMVEPELWDFKETLDCWRSLPQAAEKAKLSLATDVASFANGKGGVIVVGVKDGPPRSIEGIHYTGKELENKIKYIAEILEKYLDPCRVSYEICQVEVTGKLCIAIVVAQSAKKVGVRNQEDQFIYPVRDVGQSKRFAPQSIDEMKQDIARDNYQFIRIIRSKISSL